MHYVTGIAIRDEETGMMFTMGIGRGHDHIERRLTELGMRNISQHTEKGFLDNRGRFLTRVEAMKVAAAAGQLAEGTKPEGHLLSNQVRPLRIRTTA